ncbi:potassium transporter [Mycena floridula]|nr:potassium transporter [Mycena floridula]
MDLDLKPVTKSRWAQLKDFVESESTFFRVHLVSFTLIPLIFSAIFYASNGRSCFSRLSFRPVNPSQFTVWQQVILYLLMLCGDITTVSWMMVLVRKEYFKRRCEYIAKKHQKHFPNRAFLLASISSPIAAFRPRNIIVDKRNSGDEEPEPPPPFALISPARTPVTEQRAEPELELNAVSPVSQSSAASPQAQSFFHSPDRHHFASPTSTSPRGIEFTLNSSIRMRHTRGASLSRRGTFHTHHTARSRNTVITVVEDDKHSGFGGFPGPVQIFQRLLKRASPKIYRTLERKLTIPYGTTVAAKSRPWLDNFDLFVGRNSDFHTESLTDEQVEEIGGTEYRALRLLSYVVPAYFVLTQALAFLIFAPWLSITQKYDSVFVEQPRLVNKAWFSLFQVMSSYTGGGLMLVDKGLLPFERAYLMICMRYSSILQPIFWTASKFTKEGSDNHKVLSFLLDHPRRFPSHQTWFLVICLLGFSIIEWIGFEVLNIGLPIYDSLSVVARIVDGLFQGIAARASGFEVIAMAQFAPALQLMYVVMMYIAVAMSIRSTNVYEERSLGVFEEPPEDHDEPDDMSKLEPRQRIGRYVGWHVRRQLSIDIWWLVSGVFLVAIIERNNLLDESKKWFDLFRVLFELVSAFSGIGLSLGVPYDNFSFSGALRPLSKIVMIVIMIRGRHRGLPVAVDRAILLPIELQLHKKLPPRLEDPQISSAP